MEEKILKKLNIRLPKIDKVFLCLYLIMFVVVLVRSFAYSIENYWFFLIATLVLMAYPIYMAVKTYKGKNDIGDGKKAVNYILLLVVILLLNFSGFNIMKDMFFTEDTKDYNRVLKLYDYPRDELISHFPESLPENAEDVKFLCMGGFKFGANNIQLLYKTTDEEIDYYIEKYNPEGKVHEGDWIDYHWFKNVDEEYLCNGFIPIVLHEDEIRVANRMTTNSSGVAYNRETKEVFFWYKYSLF